MHRSRVTHAIAALIISASCKTTTPVNPPNPGPDSTVQAKIKPGEVDVGLDDLQAGFTNRRFITHAAALPYHLEGLVGHVIYIGKRTDGSCPSTVDDFYDSFEVSVDSYLQNGTKLQAATPNKVLYSNKVDKKAAAYLNVVPFGAKANGELLSEVTITDVQTLSTPDGSMAPNWETSALSKYNQATDCDAILIRGATLTLATSKDFQHVDASADLKGGVFSTGGQLYQELNNTNSELIIAIDAARVRLAQQPPDWLKPRISNLPPPGSPMGLPHTLGKPPEIKGTPAAIRP